MSSGLRVWNGDLISENVKRAAKDAIDEKTALAAADAASSHWWKNRSGQLQSSIGNEPARVRANGQNQIVGKFGTSKEKGFYGLFLERRTPFLRPAADRSFTGLTSAIKRRM